MIRKAMIFKAAMLGACSVALSGCASSGYRMPPPGAPAAPAVSGYAPAPYAPAPYAPAPVYPTTPYPAPVALPPAAAIPAAPVSGAGLAPEPVRGITGLEERKPDLCGARKNHSDVIGQPGSIIPGLGLTKTYRVVEYRGIEPQDYDPNRIVFRLDAAGTITNVDCG